MDKQYLKKLVGQGELEQAFDAMLDYGKSQKSTAWYNTLLMQYHQFKELQQDKLKGILSAEEAGLARNRILSALLSLIDELQEGEAGDAQGEPLTQKHGKTRWPFWLLISSVVLLGLIAGYFKLDLFTPEKGTEPAPAEVTIPVEKAAMVRPLHFPEGDAVTFLFSTGIEIQYRLLNGEMKNLGSDVQQVSFTIRCAARKGNGANFWDDTFRLELDEPGALLAPSSGLNELVENDTFKDGTVSFTVKGGFSSMKLALVNPWDNEDIRKLAISLE